MAFCGVGPIAPWSSRKSCRALFVRPGRQRSPGALGARLGRRRSRSRPRPRPGPLSRCPAGCGLLSGLPAAPAFPRSGTPPHTALEAWLRTLPAPELLASATEGWRRLLQISRRCSRPRPGPLSRCPAGCRLLSGLLAPPAFPSPGCCPLSEEVSCFLCMPCVALLWGKGSFSLTIEQKFGFYCFNCFGDTSILK